MLRFFSRFLSFILFAVPLCAYPVVYDPGDFINAAKRSYSVVDDFLVRWEKIDRSTVILKMKNKTGEDDPFSKFFKDHENKRGNDPDKLFYSDYFYEFNRGSFVHYFDASFTQETITNFNLKTEFGLINMDYKRRSIGFTLKYEEINPDGISPGFAISSNGAWQGFFKPDIQLLGSSQIEQGYPDEASFTDFYYNQVFDDLYALTLFLKPFIYVHAGILVNQEIDLVDGLLGNGNDVLKKQSNRFFLQCNFLSFLSQSLQYNKDSNRAEKMVSKMGLFDLFVLFSKTYRRSQLPDLNLGYQSIDFKTKELLYDPNLKHYSQQHTLFLDCDFYYYKLFYLKGKIETFLNHPNSGDSGYFLKQAYIEAGFNSSLWNYLTDKRTFASPEEFYTQDSKFFYHYFFFGFSYLTDSRSIEFGHDTPKIFGFTLGLSATIYWFIGGLNFEIRYANNYAPKIQNLIEAVDHNYYSLSLSLSF